MKYKLILFVSILVLSSWNTFSQAPNSFSFTLQVRVDGKVLDNDKNIDVIVTIYKSDKITAVYSEVISNVSTNSVGICKLRIGSGTPILTGDLVDFRSIDWNYRGYTIGFSWDGKDVRGGGKSRLKITPYALSSTVALFVDTIKSKIADTVVVAEDFNMSQNNIFNLDSLIFNNSETIDNNADGTIKITADTAKFTGILKFNSNQTIDNKTKGEIRIISDSTYITGILKIDSLNSSSDADIIFSGGIDLINNKISGVKALEFNSSTTNFSGITTIGEVALAKGGFGQPLYLDSDGKYKLSNNTEFDKSVCVALTTNSEVANTQPLLLDGYIKNANWNFTKGDLIYINSDTLSNTKPTTTDFFLQHVGYAVDVNIIYFNPLEVSGINASVIVSPRLQQILKINENSIPLSVSETPNAKFRKWYYGTSENGPFDQYLAANDNEISIQVSFASLNTYFVVCKSTYESGETVLSKPIKFLCGKMEVTPNINQILKTNTPSNNQLTISSSPVATAYQWVYDYNENGTFSSEILGSTSTTFTPIFKANGIYYVKCRAKINNTYIYSNVVKVLVSGVSLIPVEDQLVNLGEGIQTITVNDALSDSRVWFYSPNIEGPFSDLITVNEENPQAISPNQFPIGVHYIICESEGVASNPVKITVVENLISPTIQFTNTTPQVLTLNYGKTKPDSWMWYRGVNKNSINAHLNSLETEQPISMSRSDSLFYYVKAKYGDKEIVSNIASIYSGLEIISAKQMVIKQGMTDIMQVKFRVAPNSFKWYKVGSDIELSNSLDEKSKFIPINSVELIKGERYEIFCQATYGAILTNSDTVDIVISDFAITDRTDQLIPKINKLGNVLNIPTILPTQTSVKWFVQEGALVTPLNNGESTSYTPAFGNAGEYNVFCEITYPEGVISTDTVKIEVLDLRLIPNTKQVLYAALDLTTEINLVSPIPVGATIEWFVDDGSFGNNTTFAPKTFFANILEKSIYCKVEYKSNSYLSDTVKFVSGKVKITNPLDKQIYINDNITKVFATSSILDNQTLAYSLKNHKNEIIDLGAINSYKFVEFGDYVFYAKNSSYNISPWSKIFVDSTKIRVADIVLSSYNEQFIQVNSNIKSLTVSTTLSEPQFQWSYGVLKDKVDIEITGGATPTLGSIPPKSTGTYYIKCRIKSLGITKYSSTVKINIIDNKIFPIAAQTIRAYANGSYLTASTTFPYDSLRWFMSSPSEVSAIPKARNTVYTPNLSSETWQLSCRFYYHNAVEIDSITTNRVLVKSVSTVIEKTTTQYLQNNTNCSTINIKESHIATSRQWYYVRSGDGQNMDTEVAISGKTSTAFQMAFPKGYHYYVYCKSTYTFSGGSFTLESNRVDLIVPKVWITPGTDQPTVVLNSLGAMLDLNITPTDIATIGVKWYASPNTITLNSSTIVEDLNNDFITPGLPAKPGALAYIAKAVFINSFNVRSDNHVCIGSTRTGTRPYYKNGAYVYGESFFPKAGIPNNPNFCFRPSSRPAGYYWVDTDGYNGKPPVKVYCDGTWTYLGNSAASFTNCGANGRFGPTQAQINSAYGSYTLMRHPYAVSSSYGVQFWTTPVSGTYKIEVYGSKGSGVRRYVGYGAYLSGDFYFAKGSQLRIIVGQHALVANSVTSAGGGGGSFVSHNGTLKIAAGGGGGSYFESGYQSVLNANSGNEGRWNYPYSGVSNGYGGWAYKGERYCAGGGGGWYSDGGTPDYSANYGTGGMRGSLVPTGGGFNRESSTNIDYNGGFGGGGGAGLITPGGGGGFTGGAGGYTFEYKGDRLYGMGGGGGSFNAGNYRTGSTGSHNGMGKVRIRYKIH